VPRRGEPFDRFLQLLGAFIRPTTVHYCFTFEVIRFTGYGVIAEKPHISHLPGNFLCTLLYQKMIGTFLMVSTSSITMQSLGKMVLRVLAVSAKMYCLFSIFCHTLGSECSAFEGCIVQTSIASRFMHLFRCGFQLFHKRSLFQMHYIVFIFVARWCHNFLEIAVKIAKSTKICGKVCAHHFVQIVKRFFFKIHHTTLEP